MEQSCYATSLPYIPTNVRCVAPPPPGSLLCESSEYFPADVCRTVNFFSWGGGGGVGDAINDIVISGGASMASGRVYAPLSLPGRQTLEETLQ